MTSTSWSPARSSTASPSRRSRGILQEFVPNGLDGWELALDELGSGLEALSAEPTAPGHSTGEPERFLGRLRRLGEVTGTMHTVLASDASDPNFAPEEPSLESL